MDWPKLNKNNKHNKQYDLTKQICFKFEEYNKHNKQYDLTKQICFKFEEENEGVEDSDEVKKVRFDKIMSLMQEMQSLGHPPKELTGESSPAFQYDAEGNPVLPGLGDPSQCCLQ